MRITPLTFLFGLLQLVGSTVLGQEEPSRVDLFFEYSYLRFNPTLPRLNNRSFNGGGGEVTYYFRKYLGLKMELMGYGSTTWHTTVVSTIVTPRGIVPAGDYSTHGNMFTYLFGPVVRFPGYRANTFAEILVGGSNSNGYVNFVRAVNALGGTLTGQPSGAQHPFTMAAGGGLDVHLNSYISLRPFEIDYVLMRYTNPVSKTNNQNNFRYAAGVGVRF